MGVRTAAPRELSGRMTKARHFFRSAQPTNDAIRMRLTACLKRVTKAIDTHQCRSHTRHFPAVDAYLGRPLVAAEKSAISNPVGGSTKQQPIPRCFVLGISVSGKRLRELHRFVGQLT
jgi:hypothetical protein